MKDKNLSTAIEALSDTRHCDSCPFSPTLCRRISLGLFKKERCLLVVVVNEILAFHTEEHKKEAAKFKKEAKEGGE